MRTHCLIMAGITIVRSALSCQQRPGIIGSGVCMQEGDCRVRGICREHLGRPRCHECARCQGGRSSSGVIARARPQRCWQAHREEHSACRTQCNGGLKAAGKCPWSLVQRKSSQRAFMLGMQRPVPFEGSACFLCIPGCACMTLSCRPSCIPERSSEELYRCRSSPQLKLGLSRWYRLPLSPGQQWAPLPWRSQLGRPAARQGRPVLARRLGADTGQGAFLSLSGLPGTAPAGLSCCRLLWEEPSPAGPRSS